MTQTITLAPTPTGRHRLHAHLTQAGQLTCPVCTCTVNSLRKITVRELFDREGIAW